ncbi:hypothetical protein D3C75_1099270 [compost metagenome]
MERQRAEVLATPAQSHLGDGIAAGTSHPRQSGPIVVEHVAPDLLELLRATLFQCGLKQHAGCPAIGIHAMLLERAVVRGHHILAGQVQGKIRALLLRPVLPQHEVLLEQTLSEGFPLPFTQHRIREA